MQHYAPAGDQHETAYAIAAGANGDAYVVGRAYTEGAMDDMIALRLAAADGSIVWNTRVDGPEHGNDRAYDVVLDAAGDLIFTGISVNADVTADYLTVKLAAADGRVLWTRRDPDALDNDNRAGWIGLAPDGLDVIVANRTWLSGHSFDVVLFRYAGANGARQWSASYDRAGGADDLRDLLIDVDGFPLVTGVSSGDMMTLRFDPSDGGLVWDAFKDGPMGWYDLADCAIDGPDGLLLVGGYTDGGDSTWDATIVAYDRATGDEAWTLIFDGADSLTDELRGLALGPNGELYAAGYSYAYGTDMDMLALRYDFTQTAVPGAWSGAAPVSAWPNPFSERVQLRAALPAAGDYQAAIYDLQGRALRHFAGRAAAGELGLAWDGRDDAGRLAPAGVYLVRVTSEAGAWQGRVMRLR